ncbi:MAG: hypothetical protein QOG31_1485, partial [Thermoplasmata archaeon]|nr:hypothetical protein [Thermoplasmata archaeon]
MRGRAVLTVGLPEGTAAAQAALQNALAQVQAYVAETQLRPPVHARQARSVPVAARAR